MPTVEVSFLHLLFTIQTCGVTAELFAESEGGAQTTRFVGGTAEISMPARNARPRSAAAWAAWARPATVSWSVRARAETPHSAARRRALARISSTEMPGVSSTKIFASDKVPSAPARRGSAR